MTLKSVGCIRVDIHLFQGLVDRDAKLDGTRNRPSVALPPVANIIQPENLLPTDSSHQTTNAKKNGGHFEAATTTTSDPKPINSAVLAKSGSLISMTHIGVAPQAIIDELLEVDEDNSNNSADNKMETTEHGDTVFCAVNEAVVRHFLPNGQAPPVCGEDGLVHTAHGDVKHQETIVNSSGENPAVSVSGGESGEEMAGDSYAEVLPTPRLVPVFSKQTKRRASKTFRGSFPFNEQQFLLYFSGSTMFSDIARQMDRHLYCNCLECKS